MICPTCKRPGFPVKKKKAQIQEMEFVKIPTGEFMMGSPETEELRLPDEVQHKVSITKDFEMGVTPVTQAQWVAVMGENPSYFKGETLPVEQVSWYDCQEFIGRMNAGQKKYTYRLPTEAEWEYAARAGTTGPYWFPAEEIKERTWYYDNSLIKTHPVGGPGHANAWGLSDILGNVWEWCQDWYGPYAEQGPANPRGPEMGSLRVLRGGSWNLNAGSLRAAYRYYGDPGLRWYNAGFRLARSRR